MLQKPSFALSPLGSQRSPPGSQQATPLYLDRKLFSGSGAAAAPEGDVKGRVPHLISSPLVPFGYPGTGLVDVGSTAALSLAGRGCPLLPTPPGL